MNIKLSLICLLVVLNAPHSGYAQSANVSLEFSSGDNDVIARYRLSSPTKMLRFNGNGKIRLVSWKAPEEAQLSNDGQTLEFSEPTTEFSVRLKPFERDGMLDRVYSPVILFADRRSAHVYSEYLLPKDGGTVSFANEGVVLGKQFSKYQIAWRSGDVPTYLLTGRATTELKHEYAITKDAQLPVWIGRTLEQRLTALIQFYSKQFTTTPKDKPWILVSYDPNVASGIQYFRGDTNPGMVRLNFVGTGWNTENPVSLQKLTQFLAHELFHLWNAGVWKNRAHDAIWLFEGGADAAAQDALHRLGYLDDSEYKNMKTSHLLNCSLADGDSFTTKLNGRTFYTCGATIFHLAAAMNSQREKPVTPVELWKKIFLLSGTEGYAPTNLFQAIEQLQADSRQSSLSALALKTLTEGTLDWRAGLETHQDAFHLYQPTVTNPPTLLAGIFLDKLLLERVKDDCQGDISVSYDQQIYHIDTLKTCRRIQKSITLTHLGGHSMRNSSEKAWAYAREKCSKTEDLEFSNESGANLVLTCPQIPALPQNLFVFKNED